METSALQGRVGIVTGGSRGSAGQSARCSPRTARRLPYLSPEDRERTQTLASHLNGAASRLHFYETNVGVFERCKEAVDAVLKEHGKIDFLVTTPASLAITRFAICRSKNGKRSCKSIFRGLFL